MNTDQKKRVRWSMRHQKEYTKIETAIRQINLAMSRFAIAFNSERLMHIIHLSCLDEWPEGQVHLVVQYLLRKYWLINTISRVELRQQLSKVRMRRGFDPSQLLEQLNTIKTSCWYPDNELRKSS